MVVSALIGILSIIVGIYRSLNPTKKTPAVGIIIFGVFMIGIAVWLGWPK